MPHDMMPRHHMIMITIDYDYDHNHDHDLIIPKNFWWGCVAPVFDWIPLAKEILVENIPLAIRTIFDSESILTLF